MKAWRTEAAGVVCVVFTTDATRARKVTLDSTDEAGYELEWIDIKVRRWPELDDQGTLHATAPGNERRWPTERPLDPEMVRASHDAGSDW